MAYGDRIVGNLGREELLYRVNRDWQASKTFYESDREALYQEAMKLWQGEHLKTPRPGRSQLFVRKPRAIVEQIKAELLEAFFSGEDFASVEPARQDVPADILKAKVWQAYVNYRLRGHNIPWYQLCHASFDDLGVFNIACLNIEWVLKADTRLTTEQAAVTNPATGEPLMGDGGNPMMSEMERQSLEIVKDEPEIRLISPERIRADYRFDWTSQDRVQYLIHQDFVLYQDLVNLARVDRMIDLDQVELSAEDQHRDLVSTQRFKATTPHLFNDPDRILIEIWKYWYRVGEQWWFAWTYQDQRQIRKPESNRYKHGKPPYVFGFLVPESHRLLSDSTLNIHRDYFVALNGLRNQRFDNVALILNRHAIVSEDAQIDMMSFLNRRPGGATTAKGDAQKAVMWDEIPDIRASAYNEETILDRDLQESTGVTAIRQGITERDDELATQTVLRERKANIKGAVNIRVAAHTLIQPTIEMLIQLAEQYETDMTIMQIVGAALGLGGRDDLIPKLFEIQGQYAVQVYAGLGSLSRDVKLAQIDRAIATMSKLYGPLAALPLIPEYLPLTGVKNTKAVLSTLEAIIQGQAAETGTTERADLEMERARTERPPGRGNGKMPTEMSEMRSMTGNVEV